MPELRDQCADVVEPELDAELLESEQPVEWKEPVRISSLLRLRGRLRGNGHRLLRKGGSPLCAHEAERR